MKIDHPLFLNSTINYAKYIKEVFYEKNQIIFNEGSIANKISLVITGKVNISTYTYFEKEYSIADIFEKGIFGHNLVFASTSFYLGNVIAKTNTLLVHINKDDLLYLLQNDLAILKNYLMITSNNVRNITDRVKVLSQKSIKDSIMFYLTEKSKREKTNTILIKNKEALAKYLNIPRPSLSRSLIDLKNEGVIKINSKYVTLLD